MCSSTHEAAGRSSAFGRWVKAAPAAPMVRPRLTHADNGPAPAHTPWMPTPSLMQGKGATSAQTPLSQVLWGKGAFLGQPSALCLGEPRHRHAGIGSVGLGDPPQHAEQPPGVGGSQGLSEPRYPVRWAPGPKRGHTGLYSSKVPLWIFAPFGDPHTGTGAGAVEGGPCSAAGGRKTWEGKGRHIAGSPAARGDQAASGGHITENGHRGPQGTGLVLSRGGAHCNLMVETPNFQVSMGQWTAGEWMGLRQGSPGGDPARGGAVSWDGLWDGGVTT